MKLILCFCSCITLAVTLQNDYGLSINKIIKMYRRRARPPFLGVPRDPEDLPPAEPILPGHTLLRPALGMLKSAVKYPLRDTGDSLVYGNPNNLGITHGKSPYRVMYTGFRRIPSNEDFVKDLILQAARNIKRSNRGKSNSPLLLIEITPERGSRGTWLDTADNNVFNSNNEDSDERVSLENHAGEVTDDSSSMESYEINSRRRSKRKKKGSESESSSSSSYEKNPGNPYTAHKNKYYQNWIWNHFMDGDHMNVNPFSPTFGSGPQPSAVDLFFGRKWWYFNQDDYKPIT